MNKFHYSNDGNIIRVLLSTGYCLALIAVTLMPVSEVNANNSSLTTDNHTVDLEPQFVINGSDGRPCFLGRVNFTIEFSYTIHKADEVKSHVVKVPFNNNMDISGECGDGNSSKPVLSITLNNGSTTSTQLNLTFQFKSKVLKDKMAVGEWSLCNISLYYSKIIIPPGAVGDDTGVFLRDNITLFSTPMGLSFFCESHKKVWVGDDQHGAVIIFNMVHLQPFLVHGDTFSEAYMCHDELPVEQTTKTSYIIPIIVACCLAAIVGGVIIGYVVTRRVHKFKDQSDYKPM